MKNNLGCFIYGILAFISLGAIGFAVDYALSEPNEHSIKGQLAPLIALAFFIIILLATGILKPKK